MRISFGNGGWVAVDDMGLPGPLYVRVGDREGRLRIIEFYIDASQSEDAIDARDLRELPLSQLEAFIDSEADAVRPRLDVPSPDIGTLASFYATMFGQPAKQIAEGNWVVSSFIAQFDQIRPGERAVVRRKGPGQTELLTGTDAKAAIAADPTLPRVLKVERASKSKKWVGLREGLRDYRLTTGPVDGLTDEFLTEVSKAYRAATLRGESPNVAISEQTGYPLRTVQRWVYTARQRQIMPKGQKGKAT